MPIYAYRCTNCGHAKDALQRLSDPPLTVCPVCGQATLQKQVTAAGFQLKGSGWYVTDFRGDSKAKPDTKPDAAGDAAKAETPSGSGDTAAGSGNGNGNSSGSGSGNADAAATAPAAAAKADAPHAGAAPAPPKSA